MFSRVFYIFAFGCLGTTTEVWFTAASAALSQWRDSESLEPALRGHSYVWMFFIYGSAGLLLPIFHPRISRLVLPIRLLIYVLAIFLIEYLAGWFLEATTGSCPWHYDSKSAIHGYIRLDYAPFWMAFGLIIEKVFLALRSVAMIVEINHESVKSASHLVD